MKKLGIEVSIYNFVGEEGSGGARAPSKEMPYDWKFEVTLRKGRGVKVLGITGFYGSIPAGNMEALQKDKRVILVDPMEDLTVLQLKQKYVDLGYTVQVYYSVDLWIYYKMLNES